MAIVLMHTLLNLGALLGIIVVVYAVGSYLDKQKKEKKRKKEKTQKLEEIESITEVMKILASPTYTSTATFPIETPVIESKKQLELLVKEVYPSLNPNEISFVLQQLEAISNLPGNSEEQTYPVIMYGGRRFINFPEGSAFVMGKMLQGIIQEIGDMQGISKVEVVSTALIFFRKWVESMNTGRIKPLFTKYGEATSQYLLIDTNDGKLPDDSVSMGGLSIKKYTN